jgi:uncharacterized membrane protein YfcA
MFLMLVIGVLIGLVLGLTGAGGSVFAVPLLMLFLDLPVQDAMGLALAAVSLSAMYGVIIRWRSKLMFFMPAFLLGGAGILTAPLGKLAADVTPSWLLQILFALVAVFLGIRMWRQASREPDSTGLVRASRVTSHSGSQYICRFSEQSNSDVKAGCVISQIGAGLLIGFLSGFLGVGGGFLIIPTLMFLGLMPMVMAVGTSLLIIAPVSLSGFISYYLMAETIALSSILIICIGGIVGMTFGTLSSRYLAGPSLQKMFAISLILLTSFNLAYG